MSILTLPVLAQRSNAQDPNPSRRRSYSSSADGKAHKNARRRTDYPKVMAAVADSRMFGTLSEGEGQGQRIAAVVIDDQADRAAVAKGFGTGRTLGLAGPLVTDVINPHRLLHSRRKDR